MSDRIPILVIDDEPDVLAMLRTMLMSAGFEVTGVRSAQEAFQHLAFNHPAVIITDIYMTDGDGFDLMSGLRKLGFAIPIIAISGGSRGEGRNDPLAVASALGAAAILAKPFYKKDLIDTVNRVLGRPVSQED